jgi:ParB-like chromosome segregation protein Spo0J
VSAKPLTERSFRDEIAALTERLRRTIEAKVDGFAIDPEAKAKRLAAVRDPVTGFRVFAETYFPHYLTAPPNLLHLHLFDHLPAIAHRRAAGKGPDNQRGAREVIISPRGSAKSTFATQIFRSTAPVSACAATS